MSEQPSASESRSKHIISEYIWVIYILYTEYIHTEYIHKHVICEFPTMISGITFPPICSSLNLFCCFPQVYS